MRKDSQKIIYYTSSHLPVRFLLCTLLIHWFFRYYESVSQYRRVALYDYCCVIAHCPYYGGDCWVHDKVYIEKRSRELSIYMISGIPNRSICRLIFYENTLIGIFAFVIGLPVGILFSQLLEAVLSSMFGVMYVLKWNFSFNATALTCLYFLAMLFYAIRRNNKWISKITLYDLLYYERQNEKSCCMTGNLPLHCFYICFDWVRRIYPDVCRTVGKWLWCAYRHCLSGTVLFGFFLSVPEFIIMQFGNREKWKYEKTGWYYFAALQKKSVQQALLWAFFLFCLCFH